MKPLFIPLKTEYFTAFKEGTKTDELRRYGPRWNEKTCKIGRDAVLSKGYGKSERLKAVVSGFEKRHGTDFGGIGRIAIQACYGTLDVEMAIISVAIERPPCPHCLPHEQSSCPMFSRPNDRAIAP